MAKKSMQLYKNAAKPKAKWELNPPSLLCQDSLERSVALLRYFCSLTSACTDARRKVRAAP